MAELVELFYAKWFLRSSGFVVSPRLDFEAIWEMNYEASASEIYENCLRSMTDHLSYLHSSNTFVQMIFLMQKIEIADALLVVSECDMVASE